MLITIMTNPWANLGLGTAKTWTGMARTSALVRRARRYTVSKAPRRSRDCQRIPSSTIQIWTRSVNDYFSGERRLNVFMDITSNRTKASPSAKERGDPSSITSIAA